MMVTINTGEVAYRDGFNAATVQGRMIQNIRNLYRPYPHDFMGIWRREVFGMMARGEHFHLLLHAPRNMRVMMMDRFPIWLSDPIDMTRTSKRFDRPGWGVASTGRLWHLRRVYRVDGVLDYIAKVPTGSDGRALSKVARRAALPKGAREFGIIGV